MQQKKKRDSYIGQGDKFKEFRYIDEDDVDDEEEVCVDDHSNKIIDTNKQY